MANVISVRVSSKVWKDANAQLNMRAGFRMQLDEQVASTPVVTPLGTAPAKKFGRRFNIILLDTPLEVGSIVDIDLDGFVVKESTFVNENGETKTALKLYVK